MQAGSDPAADPDDAVFRGETHAALQPGARGAAGIMAAIASSAERIA
jgi:hypothetical protein